MNLFSTRNTRIILFTLLLISFLMHFRVFSLDLISFHSWRQTFTQNTVVNFFEEDFNILNPRINARGDGDGIQRLEFPIMQWIFAGFFKLFGNHIIISRILSFLIGCLSIIGFFKLIKLLFNNNYLGLLGAWAFSLSPTFFYYTLNPMPDNFALMCGIYGLMFFQKYYNNKKISSLILSSIFLSISTLSKLPFIIYYSIPFFSIVLIAIKKGLKKEEIKSTVILLIGLIFPLSWYIYVIPTWHMNSLSTGIFSGNNNLVVLLDYLQHNLISSLPELLIGYASFPLFLIGIYTVFKRKVYKNEIFKLFLICGIFLILFYLYEMNLIGKVHDYYLIPYIPLLFILVVYGAKQVLSKYKKGVLIVIILAAIMPVTTFIRMSGRWDEERPGFNKDLYMYRSELKEIGNKEDLCIVGNDDSHAIWFYHLDKKGWAFEYNNLSLDQLENMIQKGAKYLFTDSDNLKNNPDLLNYTDSLIFSKNSINVYLLKSD